MGSTQFANENAVKSIKKVFLSADAHFPLKISMNSEKKVFTSADAYFPRNISVNWNCCSPNSSYKCQIGARSTARNARIDRSIAIDLLATPGLH